MSTLTINSTYTLPISGRYANPENQNDILPVVYGEMTGVWAAPCINTVSFVYCFASHACLSSANGNTLTVSDENGVRTDFLFFNAVDYEGQGVIAMIQLLTAANGKVLVSGSGKVNTAGTLLENPVDIIEDLLGDVNAVFEHTSAAQARRDAVSAGFLAAGIMLKEQPYTFWMTAIMGSFLGDWWSNHDGKIRLRFDTGAVGSIQVAGFLVERRATRVSGDLTIKNIVNKAIIHYQLSFGEQDKRFKEGVRSNYLGYDDGVSSQDIASQLKYGIRSRVFEFDWIQQASVASIVQQRVIDRFSGKTWILTWTEYGLLNMPVEEGDYVVFSWEERKDSQGNALQNQIAQILSKEVDLDMEQITFTLKDLGVVLVSAPDIWNGVDATTGDGGTFGGDRETRRLV